MNTRRAQPYRKGSARAPSPTLAAMQNGRTLSGFHPKDIERLAQLRAKRRRRRVRRRA